MDTRQGDNTRRARRSELAWTAAAFLAAGMAGAVHSATRGETGMLVWSATFTAAVLGLIACVWPRGG